MFYNVLGKIKSSTFLLLPMVLLSFAVNRVEGGNSMDINSSAFKQGEQIPKKYTCEGVDISPPLSWSGAPGETESFALVCDDPDAPAGTWVHWILYNMPPTTKQLPESVQKTEMLPDGARQGKNDFHRTGYGGPCPPPGHGYHRYFFKLYALDSMLDLKAGEDTKTGVLRAMDGHILTETKLMGKYKR
jgi:Raf kinase inhibitor-like YbhB/YbcL family protein